MAQALRTAAGGPRGAAPNQPPRAARRGSTRTGMQAAAGLRTKAATGATGAAWVPP
jgi:hypothetical protein